MVMLGGWASNVVVYEVYNVEVVNKYVYVVPGGLGFG